MDPQRRFCHNERCWAYGRADEGHIVIHSQKERRYKCKRCSRTFSATKGTALYRAHKPHELVVTIVTLLAYGCPPQAIVAAFSLDERTVCRWQRESGRQCWRVHEHIIQANRARNNATPGYSRAWQKRRNSWPCTYPPNMSAGGRLAVKVTRSSLSLCLQE